MYVDVHFACIDRDEQRDQRVAVARQIVGIGGAHRAEQKLVAHRAAVDEEILAKRIGARQRRQGGKAIYGYALAFGRHLDRVGAEIRAEHVAEPGQTAGGARKRCREGDGRAFLAGEREGNIRAAHGKPAHDFAHRLRFGAIELEEFQSRRRRVKQVAHFDAGALPERGRLELRLGAGVNLDRPGVRLAFVPRGDGKPRHGADRRQCFAAETKRVDCHEIVVGKLRGGMAIDREREIRRGSCPPRRRRCE